MVKIMEFSIKEIKDEPSQIKLEGFPVKIGMLIKFNDRVYVLWQTVNMGIVWIDLSTFHREDNLLTSHRWRDLDWMYRVKKYCYVIGELIL